MWSGKFHEESSSNLSVEGKNPSTLCAGVSLASVALVSAISSQALGLMPYEAGSLFLVADQSSCVRNQVASQKSPEIFQQNVTWQLLEIDIVCTTLWQLRQAPNWMWQSAPKWRNANRWGPNRVKSFYLVSRFRRVSHMEWAVSFAQMLGDPRICCQGAYQRTAHSQTGVTGKTQPA